METPGMQTPGMQTEVPDSSKNWMGIVSLVIGVVGLCAWIIPLIGCPATIIGIVLGVLGLKSEQRTLSIVGIVLCSLMLLVSIGNAAFGAYLGATGQMDFLNNI